MPAVVVAAALAALYLILDPPSADLAAQTYRVGLFDRAGWIVWDNGWYGGHHLPGYSVLFPPLASLLGLQVVAALSLVGATAAFARLTRHAPAALWFTAGLAGTIVSGRLAFALGVAIATTAMLAVTKSKPKTAAALGALTALSSPVAALFLALITTAVAATAWGPAALGKIRPNRPRGDNRPLRRISARRGPHDGAAAAAPKVKAVTAAPMVKAAAATLAASIATTATLVLAFPEGGSEPFVPSAFWPALAAALIAIAMTQRALRTGAALYALLLIVAFAVDSPLGGNVARLGALLAGPLAAALLWDHRRRALALVAVPLAYWTLYPPVRDWSQAAGDPAQPAAYYEPLLAQLKQQPGVGRLEIPFTKGHWESARVAPAIPLARGWERQLDRRYDALFYADTLTPERFRAWLDDNAVHWVALPDAPLDESATAEAALVRGGLPYLDEVWHSEHWRLFAVQRPTALGATTLGADWFTTTGGLVRVHWSPYWAVTEGHGCVRQGTDDWTVVTPRPAGATVRVGMRTTPDRALSRGRRCR